jgi:hypothetical protein
LEAEAVQETPDMIVGMFLVESHLAEVLFDTVGHLFSDATGQEQGNTIVND